MPENGADLAHLWHLHVPFVGAGADLRYIFTRWLNIKHVWSGKWETLEEPNSHIGRLSLEHKLAFFNWTVPFTKLVVQADQVRTEKRLYAAKELVHNCCLVSMPCTVQHWHCTATHCCVIYV